MACVHAPHTTPAYRPPHLRGTTTSPQIPEGSKGLLQDTVPKYRPPYQRGLFTTTTTTTTTTSQKSIALANWRRDVNLLASEAEREEVTPASSLSSSPLSSSPPSSYSSRHSSPPLSYTPSWRQYSSSPSSSSSRWIPVDTSVKDAIPGQIYYLPKKIPKDSVLRPMLEKLHNVDGFGGHPVVVIENREDGTCVILPGTSWGGRTAEQKWHSRGNKAQFIKKNFMLIDNGKKVNEDITILSLEGGKKLSKHTYLNFTNGLLLVEPEHLRKYIKDDDVDFRLTANALEMVKEHARKACSLF